MSKVATYNDLLAYNEAQKAYIEQLEAKLAERPSDTLNIRSGNGQAQLDALEEMRGRVPLMDGWYVRNGTQAVAWTPTREEAHEMEADAFDSMARLADNSVGLNLSLSPADFAPLREAYYATTPQA
jgi:hypothetical protein